MTKIRSTILRQKNYQKVTSEYRRDAVRIIAQATDLVRNTALESIAEGGKSGITYKKYNPSRIHTASGPGQAPATDTGFLISNIHKDIDAYGLVGYVESRAPYSSELEFGTQTMSPRPFMQPAIEQNRRNIRNLAKRLLRT